MAWLGIDLGSSSVKAAVLDDDGAVIGGGHYPPTEMPIAAPRPGFAEQDPEAWWQAAQRAVAQALTAASVRGDAIEAIGVAYQMHGLVCLDRDFQVLRPSIIWCDSRAVAIGDEAMAALGREICLGRLLNSPGNFTASKLAWVARNEPAVFDRIRRVCLPGDYLAGRMTGEFVTTVSGLSEGMLWDFESSAVAGFLLDHHGVPGELLAPRVPTFGAQGQLTAAAAESLGLYAGTPVTYRAGDQPNNALSLNVLQAGEVAATAGTSGVVYGVSDQVAFDPQSRINSFAHVNHSATDPRIGLLLCINGTGIANAWTKRTVAPNRDYDACNELAATVAIGSDGLVMLPFGNGAERMLGNAEVGAQWGGLDFNRHQPAHLLRAVQEGIAFSFSYGMDLLRQTGVDLGVIRAGHTNLFASPLFRQTLADATGACIELYSTDGAAGAARGAWIGATLAAGGGTDIDAIAKRVFGGLERVGATEPEAAATDATQAAYRNWLAHLHRLLPAADRTNDS